MSIKKMHGTITKVTDLTPTAKQLTFSLPDAMPFIAGSFVNVFFTHDGATTRRAYSISSSDEKKHEINLSIRHNLKGIMSPQMWLRDFTGEQVELMGPLGVNTADKMKEPHAFLFGFGIGTGVIKSVAEHLIHREGLESLTVMTGNRGVDELVHKDYFDALSSDPRVSVSYIVSIEDPTGVYPKGYIQDYIGGLDFNHADVYVCGQEIACATLVEKIKATNPEHCNFFIEGFH